MDGPRKRTLILSIAAALLLGLFHGAIGGEVSFDRLLKSDADPDNWPTYYRNYQGWRYSPLTQISTQNVKKLVVKWAFSTGPDEGLETTPIVVDGVMYLTSEKNAVFALDAATGRPLWRHVYELPENLPRFWNRVDRGVAVAEGKILHGTLDAYLMALDAKTGSVLWKVRVGDYEAGETFTSPPLIIRDKAIVGLGTREYPGRGFIDAYEINTGKLVWRTYTIPAPGEPGHETWGSGDAWRYGCAAAWLPGTYDAELNLVYLATSQPCPGFDGEVRPGDNLYADSILALDPETGTLKWYFQLIPHDVWELDATTELILVDVAVEGRPVKAVLLAGKNGFFYVLDRTNGRFLHAKPFVSRITWTKGLDRQGRPIPDAVPTRDGAILCPSAWGAKNWNHAAFSPRTGYVYVPAIDLCFETRLAPAKPQKGVVYFGGMLTQIQEDPHGSLVAIDPTTGETKWRYRSPYPMFSSVLTTAGGLVLTGDAVGNALAFEASTGQLLWTFNTGSGHRGSPITYAVNGRQHVAIPAGMPPRVANRLASWYPELNGYPLVGSTLFVFGLSESE